jgi:hypothetical protein
MTAAKTTAVGEGLPPFEDYSAPLVKSLGFRCSAPMYAGIAIRALCEGTGEGTVIRRWLTRGAAAEGIDLKSF